MATKVSERDLPYEQTIELRRRYESRSLLLLKHLAEPRKLALGYGAQKRLAEAQTYLGHVYMLGLLGQGIDVVKGFKLYHLAAKQGDGEATFCVSACFDTGTGTSRDESRMLTYLERAAKLNYPKAMHKFGMLLVSGSRGLKKHPVSGKLFVDRAVKLTQERVPQFLHDLATLHDSHLEPALSVDNDMALLLYSKAARFGYAQSQYTLGCCYDQGRLVERDPKEALRWFSRAAKQEHPKAQLKLSGLYLRGLPNVITPNEQTAFEWAHKAASHGLPEAEFGVGYFYQYGIGTTSDLDQARRWYMRAAYQNYEKGVVKLKELKKL
jgi:TPR repeat protein